MKTIQQIRYLVRADREGRDAAREGKTLDDNPYPEDAEEHWRWLNAWCNEMVESLRTPAAP